MQVRDGQGLCSGGSAHTRTYTHTHAQVRDTQGLRSGVNAHTEVGPAMSVR
jgi:hypothetical protein